MKKKIPKYISDILKLYPKIKSGRKKYAESEFRVEKNLILTKNYFKKNKN